MIKNNLSDNKLMDNLSREMRSNVFVNYILRGITILLGLVSTRVNLSYLGMSLYGQWATIASVASWINYGDFGIGNGFRNEFAKAAAEGDKGQQKKLLVSTALMAGRLSIGLFFVLLAVTEIIFATDTMNFIKGSNVYNKLFFLPGLVFGTGKICRIRISEKLADIIGSDCHGDFQNSWGLIPWTVFNQPDFFFHHQWCWRCCRKLIAVNCLI